MDTKEIVERLNKIIELLEFRNSIEKARNELMSGNVYFTHKQVFQPPQDAINPDMICTCGNHKHGESTGGWWCPVHGQCF